MLLSLLGAMYVKLIGDGPIEDYPTKLEPYAQGSIPHQLHCGVLSTCTNYWS